MIYSLENNSIKVTASTKGGELHSITKKDNKLEYLWDGNPAGWKYHAPILFPIVGKVKDSKYKVDGKVYELPQHGLARISEFKIKENSKEAISFELEYSDESLKVYPYKFLLEIRYSLDVNCVNVEYKVTNLDNKKIYFSIGAHPAFISPRNNESIEDCYFEFNNVEQASINKLTESGYLTREKESYLENTNIINLSKDTFNNDALVFNHLKSNKIKLKSRKNDMSVELDFTGFPFLGLWAPKNGANLICIEPWFGHADYDDFEGELKEKEDIIELDIEKVFNCTYKITVE